MPGWQYLGPRNERNGRAQAVSAGVLLEKLGVCPLLGQDPVLRFPSMGPRLLTHPNHKGVVIA